MLLKVSLTIGELLLTHHHHHHTTFARHSTVTAQLSMMLPTNTESNVLSHENAAMPRCFLCAVSYRTRIWTGPAARSLSSLQ